MKDDLEKLVAAHKAEIHEAPAHVKQQWHDAIDEAAAMESGRARQSVSHWHPTSFFWGVAVTAALAIGIGIGFFVSDGDDTLPDLAPPLIVATGPAAVSTPLDRGVQVYLRDSGRYLSGLEYGDDQRALALQILEQNRLFEVAAEHSGSSELARVLRAFEPTLMQLAVAELTPGEAEVLRARLEFQMKAMLTKMTTDPSDKTHTT